MTRTALTALSLLTLVACAGGDRSAPAPTVIVSDSTGRPFQPALSPDGTRIAFGIPVNGRGAIHVANADGTNAVRITNGVWDRNPVWSPDGRWIAYVGEAPSFEIYVVASEGGEVRQLTSGPARDETAGWLPDGTGVVFYRYGAGDVQTLVAPLDGSPIHPIVPPPGGNQFVAVSPDGTKAAFDLHRGTSANGTIWVQDMAGGAARQLTTEGLETAFTARMWSPDSRSLLFLSRRTGTTDIWVADVETGALRQLTNDVRNDFTPGWSPDGRWVVFLSDRGGQRDVWITSAEGGAAHRVTNDLAAEFLPQWTPDGRSIVYARDETSTALRLAALGGGSDRSLVAYDGYQFGGAVIAPDGGTVLFVSDRSGNDDIWSVPLAGGEPTPFAASPLEDRDPRFSPDGTMVAFASNRAGSSDLWVTPAQGGEARPLTNWPSTEAAPRWSPGGETIAFLSDHDATQNEVWIIPAAGGEATRLTTGNTGANNLQWSADGRALYFVAPTPDGADDVYRVPVSGGPAQRLGAGQGGSIGNLQVSPAGGPLAYDAYVGGWGYLEVVPADGGAPRRLTASTDVFQNRVVWSPDGTRIAVSDYDYAHDSYDLKLVTWPEGAWSALTASPQTAEFPEAWTPDGRDVLYMWGHLRSQIMRVSVADLLSTTP